MDIYNDYSSFMGEIEELVLLIQKTPLLEALLGDIIKICDYLLIKHQDKVPLSPEEEDVFEIGFDYLYNMLSDLKVYYFEYFKKDPITFSKAERIIMADILLEDLKRFLIESDLYDEDNSNIIEKDLMEIEHTLISSIKDEALMRSLEEKIMNDIKLLTPKKPTYYPTYFLFSSLVDELGI